MALSRSVIPAFLSRDWWDVWDFPARIMDQHFGLGITVDDYVRPARQLSNRETGQSCVKNEPGSFQVMLDVSHFSPNEITVKTVNNSVVIRGKHEEKADQHGFISREFTRRYMLPSGAEAETVTSSLSPDGILTVQAPKKAIEPPPTKEREVPITMKMPVTMEPPKQEQKTPAPPADVKPQQTAPPPPPPEAKTVVQQPATTPEEPKVPQPLAPEPPKQAAPEEPKPQPPPASVPEAVKPTADVPKKE